MAKAEKILITLWKFILKISNQIKKKIFLIRKQLAKKWLLKNENLELPKLSRFLNKHKINKIQPIRSFFKRLKTI